MYKYEKSQDDAQLRYLFITLYNNQTKHSLHYIDNINLQSLHCIQYNAFNAHHLSNYIHRIAFDILLSSHCIHYIGFITLHSS